ncbi:pentatricopeptide repeat-containing protein ELI1, chloroplastic [Cucurbita pepo subsp. pepo]|uniref:pentatricopeptide repeat-containing protein ELI1, chloroplastic n=1 Tax=Cucurbita pepo subsp. pepo TaxID=3664 RepID=UPI000C9D4166|nr:pentatricopeptide repeat-containing protein ELI1, chloroplastic [Cucurbita pepo subsp. pepo]
MTSSFLTASPASPPPIFTTNCSSVLRSSCSTARTSDRFQQVESFALLIDKSKSVDRLLQIHASVLRHGLYHNPILNFKLQRSYAALGRLDYSVAVFNTSDEPNVFSFSAIIHSHVQCGLFDRALNYYLKMLNGGVEPNVFTFSSVLKSCSLELGKVLHCQAIKFGFDSDLYVRTGLVDVYARGGDVVCARQLFDKMSERSLVSLTAMLTCYVKLGELGEARALFDGMKERDVVCWNVMIGGYAQNGVPNESLKLFRRMLMAKVMPNEVTVLAVLSACGQLGALESGRWVHSYIENKGIQMNVHVGTALVDMYSKCGSLEDARLVFDQIRDKDVVAWNSMIVGYAMHGFSQHALKLFEEMSEIGYQPTDITFIGILSACSHGGLVEEGRSYFRLMRDKYRIEPKVEHYGCIVNLLGRAGHLEEAYELVKNMRVAADPVIWGTLLGSCRLHGDIKLGEEIAEFLVDQKLANSGTYVLLSNIYAATGNWEGVSKMRTLMKEHGIEKEPGCSSIEVNNKVHEFLAGERKHPKSKEIYVMLNEINSWLKAHRYTPQTDVVLHDLGEEQKERSLEVHSEKLAVAFGLISTQPGTTIKIVKNLRVCSDCHAVMKLISKITGRKIVMRDRNRFHHFEDGLCSCGGYW